MIGRFYNGRDHSTVCHSIQRIEAVRESDSEVDALLAELKQQLSKHDADTQIGDYDRKPQDDHSEIELEKLADMIAERVCAYLEKRLC